MDKELLAYARASTEVETNRRFEDLASGLHQLLMPIVQRYFPAEHTRGDAFQEVIIQIHQKRAAMREVDGPVNWVCRVAIFKCLNMIRDKNSRAHGAAVAFGPEHELAVSLSRWLGINPDDEARVSLVEAALPQLGEKCRTLLEYSVDGKSTREMSKLTGLKVTSVYTTLNRCRKKLRKAVEELEKLDLK